MILRLRDVVRFRRGSNEYTGEVVKRFSAVAAVRVRVEAGEWMVASKHIVRIERPVLTVAEQHALAVLAEHGALTTLGTHEIGKPIASKTLSNLLGRGFVEGSVVGVVGSGRRVLWGLTDEGRRVQRESGSEPLRAV